MSSSIDCCYAAGGRVRITANGNIWSARAAVTITPINFERKVESNQDGSIYVTTKPIPAEAEITLSDKCGLDIRDIMGCPIDVTIELIDVRRRYLFSKAVVVGRPKLNTETGEIHGLIITSNVVSQENT
jgi:hypothetical protein